MKIGSHSQEHLAKLVPQLDAEYQRAVEHREAAREALVRAEATVLEKKEALVEATTLFIRKLSEPVVSRIVDLLSARLDEPRFFPEDSATHESDNGQ